MGYVFDFKEASAYRQWSGRPAGQKACELQCRLMHSLLKPARGERVLAVGCGPGVHLQDLVNLGLAVSAIDASPYMLDIARDLLGHRVDLHRGFAEDLPFDDNSFHHACIINTLEFASDPAKVLAEACRVARQKVFVGVINRWALQGVRRRIEGVFRQTIFNRAAFFSVWEVQRLLVALLGPVPIQWRTAGQFSSGTGRLAQGVERNGLVQRLPFGAFAGVAATLAPRYRTDPLAVVNPANHRPRPVAG